MAKAVRIGAEGYRLKLDGAVQEIDGRSVVLVDVDFNFSSLSLSSLSPI